MTSNHRPKPQCNRSAFQEFTLKQRARVMRHFPTESEAALWRLLKGRQLGVSFKRQVRLLGYIVDFYASEAKLVVEVDGGYHAERVALDAKRQRRLERAGIELCGWRVKWSCGSHWLGRMRCAPISLDDFFVGVPQPSTLARRKDS